MKTKLDMDWGVVQRLLIEADIFPALLGGCMIACAEHKNASHVIEVNDPDGGNALSLRWTAAEGANPLPFELNGENEIAEFVRSWLQKKAVYPNKAPDTDGDAVNGFRIETRSFYDVLTIKPIYIVYGK